MADDKSKKQVLQEQIYGQMEILRENEAFEKLKKLLDETYAFEELHDQVKNILLCLEESSKDLKLVKRYEYSRGKTSTRFLF